mmetsp:Transcript_109794/g.321492  ORF Transcript_109794/g.321492 Transcript_109794/m.321492 type:complete len:228 (-) Transcript_109794:100-783(-)
MQLGSEGKAAVDEADHQRRVPQDHEVPLFTSPLAVGVRQADCVQVDLEQGRAMPRLLAPLVALVGDDQQLRVPPLQQKLPQPPSHLQRGQLVVWVPLERHVRAPPVQHWMFNGDSCLAVPAHHKLSVVLHARRDPVLGKARSLLPRPSPSVVLFQVDLFERVPRCSIRVRADCYDVPEQHVAESAAHQERHCLSPQHVDVVRSAYLRLVDGAGCDCNRQGSIGPRRR